MAYTFDLGDSGDTLQISRVRSVIDDVTAAGSPTEGTDYFLSDERIQANLDGAAVVVNGEWPLVWQASADCLRILAKNAAYVKGSYKGPSETFDGPSEAAQIIKLASALENKAKANSEEDAETVTDAQLKPVCSSPAQAVTW